jgi:hypothetical protein
MSVCVCAWGGDAVGRYIIGAERVVVRGRGGGRAFMLFVM